MSLNRMHWERGYSGKGEEGEGRKIKRRWRVRGGGKEEREGGRRGRGGGEGGGEEREGKRRGRGGGEGGGEERRMCWRRRERRRQEKGILTYLVKFLDIF